MIMATCQDGAAEGVIGGDVDAAFVGKDAGFDLPVSESRAEREGNVFMHGLESLQNEGVTRGGGFNSVGEGGVDEIDKEGWWKEGDIGVVGVICGEEVGSAGKGVGSGKKFARNMDQFQVEVREVDKPVRLTVVERLGLAEISKVLVVSEDLYGERGAVEVVAPGFQGANNGEKLPVINVIIAFSGRE